jgi:hypothetical protein
MKTLSSAQPKKQTQSQTQEEGRWTQNEKMKNKTNFRRAKININLALTKHYENEQLPDPSKTKPILPVCSNRDRAIELSSFGVVADVLYTIRGWSLGTYYQNGG